MSTTQAQTETTEVGTGMCILSVLIPIVSIGAALIAHGKGDHKRAKTFWGCLLVSIFIRAFIGLVTLK